MIREDIVLIADPLLIPHISFRDVAGDDPEVLETEISIVAATDPAQIVADRRRCFEIEKLCGFLPVSLSAPGTVFSDAFRAYVHDLESGAPGRDHRRSLVIVLSASLNRDADLMQGMWTSCHKGTMGLVYIDLGGYLDAVVHQTWLELADYLVFTHASVLKRKHLQSLWSWIPECRRGFQMYHYEGHHPGERTWLSQSPSQFGFHNMILERKLRDWGPLKDDHDEDIVSEPAVGGDA
jgi:hypothetical protein